MKKMTKAERIFDQTMHDSRQHIMHWGFGEEYGTRWSGLSCSEDEQITIRTLNAMEKLADAEARMIDDYEKLETADPERVQLYRNALQMTRNTMDAERYRINLFKAYNKGKISFEEVMDHF